MKLFVVFGFLLGLYITAQYIKKRCASFDIKTKSLQNNWKTSREARKHWKDEHYLSFNFDDPKYQELWEVEIGSEDLYLLHLSKIYHGASISWHDYKCEREEFRRERS